MRPRVTGTVVAAVVIAVIGMHRLALDDLRRVEADHVAARRATACAIAGLERFGGSDDLDEAVSDAIRTASTQVSELRGSLDAPVFPYPSLGRARASVADALRAQIAFYAAVLDDPQGTDDELDVLRERNKGAERAVASARRWLLVGAGADWAQRASCP